MANIKIKNVRLSFPSVFKKATFNGQETKYEATFLISKKDEKTYKVLSEAIEKLLAEKKAKVKKDKIALKDGDDSEYPENEGYWTLKAASNKRPLVVDRDKSVLTEDDDVIYGGCYVSAIVDFWFQDNQYGKRVNCNLYGIQFMKDGERFGTDTGIDVDAFDDLSDDEDGELWD
jgi:hypothetical protein